MNKTQYVLEQIRRTKAYQAVFETDNGKLVLEDLKSFCGFENCSVCEQNPNSLQTHFNEGKRRVFLRILSQINRKVTDE